MSMCYFPLFVALICIFSTCQSHSLVRRYDSDEIEVDGTKHDLEFFSFVTRPDLDAPRWDIKVYNESALAPGYWFVAPYGIVEQTDNDKAYVAPHIYDGSGQLIWSGAAMFARFDTFSFGVSDIGGTDMITTLYPHGSRGMIITKNYELYDEVYTGVSAQTTNMHDFQVVDNGKRGLYLTKDFKTASREEALKVNVEGNCYVEYNGFEERDIETGEVTFTWTSEGRIGLDESTMFHGDNNVGCDNSRKYWDWIHLNSVEKLPDGDYLLSGRRTYAIYKISHKDGSILWRLGGKENEFEIDGHFSGQHDVRCLSQNNTHLLLSMMDNAKGPGPPRTTNPFSRGLILSVNTADMTAKEVLSFDHPHHDYADQRGNLQILRNGNGFVGWTNDALISEYTPEGHLIAEAQFPSGLKTYRGFKSPWVGLPRYPPDVHSQNFNALDQRNTMVHVSWNGATEVAYWNLYGAANEDGSDSELLLHAERTGFETQISYTGYAAYVVVEGIDHEGNSLGQSRVVQTREASNRQDPAAPEEVQWLKDNFHSLALIPQWGDFFKSLIKDPLYVFLLGVLACVAVAFAAVCMRWVYRKYKFSWRRKQRSYVPIDRDEEEKENEGLLEGDERNPAESMLEWKSRNAG